MHTFEVGKPYSLTRSSWPEGVEYNYTKHGHELKMFMNGLTNQEIKAVTQGDIKFAFAVEGDLIFFLFDIDKAFTWSDCPYSVCIVPNELRPKLEQLGENERNFLQIFLIDASTGILEAMRIVTFSPEFTRKLELAVQKQLEKPITKLAYDHQVSRVQAQIPTEVLLSRAIAYCVGGK